MTAPAWPAWKIRTHSYRFSHVAHLCAAPTYDDEPWGTGYTACGQPFDTENIKPPREDSRRCKRCEAAAVRPAPAPRRKRG